MLARLDEAGEGHEAYAGRVAALNRIAAEKSARAWEAESERRLRASKRWEDGVIRGLRRVAEEAGDYASATEEATVRAFAKMEDALVKFATTGKLEFSDLVNHIIADLARIAIRKSITEPLAEGLEGILGSLFPFGPGTTPGTVSLPPGGAAGLLHEGGVAGALGGRRRVVSPEFFLGAPRYHRGGIAGQLRPNEVPIIAERGEGVFTPEQMAALGAPRIEFNFINQGTAKQETGREARFEGDRWVLSVMTDDVDNNGPFTRRLLGATGLRRRGSY